MGGELYLHIEVDIDKDAFIFKKVVQNNLLVEEKKTNTDTTKKQTKPKPALLDKSCLFNQGKTENKVCAETASLLPLVLHSCSNFRVTCCPGFLLLQNHLWGYNFSLKELLSVAVFQLLIIGIVLLSLSSLLISENILYISIDTLLIFEQKDNLLLVVSNKISVLLSGWGALSWLRKLKQVSCSVLLCKKPRKTLLQCTNLCANSPGLESDS